MKTWPNWVDFLVLCFVLRALYVGFIGGIIAEILNSIGLVSITSLMVNYSAKLSEFLRTWISVGDPMVIDWILFWVEFFVLVLLSHRVVRLVAGMIKWERMNWLTQALGIVLGGCRGLWWSGLLVLALTASGVTYLRESVEEKSVSGPYLLSPAREVLERVTDRFPGAELHSPTLLPPLKRASR